MRNVYVIVEIQNEYLVITLFHEVPRVADV
jgi:hypothetical protein